VRLQRGPKSYSYSPFVEALSLFYDSSNEDGTGAERESTKPVGIDGNNNSDSKDEDDGLEAFLGECENESDSDDSSSFDCYGDTDIAANELMVESTMGSNPCDHNHIETDLVALELLIVALTDAKLHIKKNVLASSDSARYSEQDQFCLILIQSEINTLAFFLAVAYTLKRCLNQMEEDSTSSIDVVPTVGTDECKEHTQHVRDVVSAFVAIRCSSNPSK
jgi:hypothetical protein